MPPKPKKQACNKCSRCKLRKQVVYPQIHCKGRPDLLVLSSYPSFNDDKVGIHFSNKASMQYLRPMLKEVTDNYIIDTAVRCFSNGQPTENAINSCKPNWMGLVKEHNPKVIIVLGKYAAEAVMGKKIKLDKVAGQSLGVDYDGKIIPTVFNYTPDYVEQLLKKKGGASEKAEKLWFDTWDIAHDTIKGGLAKKPDVRILTTFKSSRAFLDFLYHDHKDKISYDYEAWGDKNTLRPELCSDYKVLSIGVGYNNKGIAFPLDYPKHFSKSNIEILRNKWMKVLKKQYIKIAHNAKFEHKVNLYRFKYTQYLYDTMLIMNIINELAPSSLGVVGRYFGFTWSGYKVEMAGIQQKPIETPLPELLKYNALDALLTYGIFDVCMDKFDVHDNMKILEMKQRYAQYLAEVEMNGMYANVDDIPEIRLQLVKEKEEAENKMYEEPAIKKVERWCLASKKEKGKFILDKKGCKVQNIKSFKKTSRFNPKGPTQMKRLCLNELKLPVKPTIKWKEGKKTESYSFDKRTLSQFEETYPIVKELNKIRSINSMFSGFLNKYEDFTGPKNCVHTNYNQVVVLTGRLSSTDPNLQNIPTDSIIKRVFSSRYGDKGLILSADYKQIEPRILAGWSEDPALCEALNGGFDLHTFVASKIYDVDYEDVTYEQRQLGKRMNLGQIYGQTPEGLADAANISLEHARELQQIYFERFYGIKEFRIKFHTIVRRTGLSKDLFGGMRHLPNAQKGNRMMVERAERQASNFPIQSTANHFCLIGLCEVMKLFKERKLPAIVIGTVHDSIIVDFIKKYKNQIIKAVKDGLLVHNLAPYWKDKPVPMAIDISIGVNYKELKEIKI